MRHDRGLTFVGLLAILAIGGLLTFGLMKWDDARLASAHQAGYDLAKKDAATERQAAENRALLNQREQIITLTNRLKGAQRDYNQAETARTAADRRAAELDQRLLNLTDQQRLAADLAAAGHGPVSDYAATATGLYRACRAEYRSLGLGPGGCAQAAAAAHAQKSRADALSDTRYPRYQSPFNTKE